MKLGPGAVTRPGYPRAGDRPKGEQCHERDDAHDEDGDVQGQQEYDFERTVAMVRGTVKQTLKGGGAHLEEALEGVIEG